MYFSIPRPTVDELDDTIEDLEFFDASFQRYLDTAAFDHSGIQMTAQLHRHVHMAKGAFVPREMVVKLAQPKERGVSDHLEVVCEKLDSFLAESAPNWSTPIQQIRDGILLGRPVVIFNALFSNANASNSGSTTDLTMANDYRDFIFSFSEAQCEFALKKIDPILKRKGINPLSFTMELDLYDSAGPSLDGFTAVYNILYHGNLSRRLHRQLVTIVW